MKVFKYILIVVALGALVFWVFRSQTEKEYTAEPQKEQGIVSKLDPANMVYDIEGDIFTLQNGRASKKITLGAVAEENILLLINSPVYGDLDSDGDMDVAVWLVNDSGGTGKFYYGALIINDTQGSKTMPAVFLGDRITPQNIEIQEGKAVYNFLERKEDDPFTAEPTVERKVEVYSQ